MWLNLEFFEHINKADDGTLKGSTIPMVDLGTYIFKDLNIGKIKSEETLTYTSVEELYDSEHVLNSTKPLRAILDAK